MNVFEAASRAVEDGVPAALATVIGVTGSTPRSEGARMLIYEDGTCVGTVGGGAVERKVRALALEVIAEGRPRRYHATLDSSHAATCGGDMEVYVEPLGVRTPMILFGAGHIAAATAPLLRSLGYVVTVVDDRTDLATPERFAGCRVVHADPVAWATGWQGDGRTQFLLMTHLHQRDQAILGALVAKEHGWIGMLGSARKRASVFGALRRDGVGEAQLAAVRCPVGLEVGAETPIEIAISIAAQLVAHRHGVEGLPTAKTLTGSHLAG